VRFTLRGLPHGKKVVRGGKIVFGEGKLQGGGQDVSEGPSRGGDTGKRNLETMTERGEEWTIKRNGPLLSLTRPGRTHTQLFTKRKSERNRIRLDGKRSEGRTPISKKVLYKYSVTMERLKEQLQTLESLTFVRRKTLWRERLGKS